MPGSEGTGGAPSTQLHSCIPLAFAPGSFRETPKHQPDLPPSCDKNPAVRLQKDELCCAPSRWGWEHFPVPCQAGKVGRAQRVAVLEGKEINCRV